jgi:hypothetical protein
MLKASQNRTNRAAFWAAATSSTPACTRGWLPTMPTTSPSIRASTQITLPAQDSCSSMNSPSSTNSAITRRMSYGWFGSTGTISASRGRRSVSAPYGASRGGVSRLFPGSRDSR